MLRHVLSTAVCLGIFIPLTVLIGQSDSAVSNSAQKKPSILIIEFADRGNLQENAGLSMSIPTALVDQLEKAGSVEILAGAATLSDSSGGNDLGSDKSALKIAGDKKKDIVIFGTIAIISDGAGEQLELKAKAIDVRSGLKIADRAQTELITGDLSPLIHRFAGILAHDVQEAVAKESTPFWRDEMGKYAGPRESLLMHVAPYSSISLQNYKYYAQSEIGGRAEISRKIFYPWLHPMLSAGSATAQPESPVSSLLFYFAQGGLTYPIGWRTIVLSPFVLGGIHGGKVISSSTEINFLLPSVEGGFKTDYFISKTVGLSLSASYVALFDSVLPISVLRFSFGIAFRL